MGITEKINNVENKSFSCCHREELLVPTLIIKKTCSAGKILIYTVN